jgi:hypothetical protein
MGISAGWGDVYTWDLPAQYIDITKNVPDGVYQVVSRSNPDGMLAVADRNSETGVTCIQITGTTVKVLKAFPSQPNWAPLPSCSDKSHVLGAKTKHKARHKRHRAAHHRHSHTKHKRKKHR